MNKTTPTQKALACMLALSVAMCAAFFSSGCTTTGDAPRVTRADVITAAEIAAGLAIGDDYQLALQYVRDAREYIQSGENATVDQVVDHLLNRALHSKLEPGQAIAVKRFIDRFRGHFALEVEQVGIDPDVLVTVNEVLDAVERVALEIERYGAAQPRTYAMAEPLDESLWGYLTDKRTREAYPLFGPAPQKVDPKWHPHLRHMLENPQPLPPEVEAHFEAEGI